MRSRLSVRLAVIAGLVLVFISFSASLGHAQKTDNFASLSPLNPIGVSASPSRVLVSIANCRDIYSITAGARVLYTTLPPHPFGPTNDCEGYLTAVPSGNGFMAEDVYAAQGNRIYKIPAGLSTPTLFVTLPDAILNGTLEDAHTSLSFDNVGTFGGGLIVVMSRGQLSPNPPPPDDATQIFLINSSGAFTQLGGTYPNRLEGPAVVPSNSPSLAGQLLVAAEQQCQVQVINTAGVVFGTIPNFGGTAACNAIGSPESVHIVPPTLCTFQGSSFFSIQHISDMTLTRDFKPGGRCLFRA
jgi:hypothetical protein